MAAGIKEQIDDLDHLLDQLLKLPIDRVKPAPATILMKPRVAAEEEVEVEEDTPTLRFGGKEIETKPMLTLAAEGEILEDEVEDRVNIDIEEHTPSIVEDEVQKESSHSLSLSMNEPLPANPSPQEEEASQTQSPSNVETQKVQTQNVPLEEIPWIDDEPIATGPGKGPQVQIILGPTSNVIVASKREESQPRIPAPRRRGWLFWVFWTVTWCFDNTLGHWFPWLRRPTVKFMLGLVGVFLFAVSIYLAWTGWLR